MEKKEKAYTIQEDILSQTKQPSHKIVNLTLSQMLQSIYF
jgi:hypothetical protein